MTQVLTPREVPLGGARISELRYQRPLTEPTDAA